MEKKEERMLHKKTLNSVVSILALMLFVFTYSYLWAKDIDYTYKKLPEKPAIFINLHIGKTGGSTMNNIITAHFTRDGRINCISQPEQCHPYVAMRKINKNFCTNLSEKEKWKIKLTGGHIGLEVFNARPKGSNAKAFAIVREPKSLILSTYWFGLQDFGFEKPLKEMDILTCDDNLAQFIKNMQSIEMSLKDMDITHLNEHLICFIKAFNYNNDTVRWFIRNDTVYDSDVPVTEAVLKEAQENIKRDFLFVGLAERFDETVIVLRRLMGWPFDEKLFYTAKNKTEFKMPEASYPDSILDQVSERFYFEKKLYAWLEKRFNSLIKLLGKDFNEEVRIYKRLNYLYQKNKAAFEVQLRKVQNCYKWAKKTDLHMKN